MNWVLNNIIELFREYHVHADESIDALAEDCCHVFEERVEKYRWHDLRKNTEDLPLPYELIQWETKSNVYIGEMRMNKDFYSTEDDYDCGVDRCVVHAWRYLETFDEMEDQ